MTITQTVPAKTGAVDEYQSLSTVPLAPAAVTAIVGWLGTTLPAR